MSSNRNKRDIPFYVAMVGPAVFLFLAIIAWPIAQSVWLSFTDYSVSAEMRANLQGENYLPSFVGIEHYIRMFSDEWFWKALWNNLIVVFVSVFGEIPIGLALAYLLYRKMVRGQGFFQSMVFLPNFVSTVIVGIIWRLMIAPDGPLTQILQLVTNNPGAHIDWLENEATAMIPVSIALIWMYTGFFMVIFLANMQKLDSGLVEAASIDGASEFQVFFKIIVPMLSGIIVVNCILAIAGSLKGFDLIWAIAGNQGGLKMQNTMVLPVYQYNNAFSTSADPDTAMSFGSAISNVIVAISVSLIVIANWVGRKFKAGEAV
jgi:raffinose/stachyose/melibiose transport system permease protein